jgi:hypothetical protein
MIASVALQSAPTGLSPSGILVVLALLAIGGVVGRAVLKIAWKLLVGAVLVVIVLLAFGVAV